MPSTAARHWMIRLESTPEDSRLSAGTRAVTGLAHDALVTNGSAAAAANSNSTSAARQPRRDFDHAAYATTPTASPPSSARVELRFPENTSAVTSRIATPRYATRARALARTQSTAHRATLLNR